MCHFEPSEKSFSSVEDAIFKLNHYREIGLGKFLRISSHVNLFRGYR
jgi:hypothetical protein